MSRTNKDKPYRVLQQNAKINPVEAYHDHIKLGKTFKVSRELKDADGNVVMETKEITEIYFRDEEYERKTGQSAGLLPFVQDHVDPAKHGKKAWIQYFGKSEGLTKILEEEYKYRDYWVNYYVSMSKRAIFVRKTVTVPVTVLVDVPYYEYDECSINEPLSSKNDWGWDLPCTYSPQIYRSGNNSPYQRNRKHREARRNRYVAKRENRMVVRNINTDGFIDEESDYFESIYVTDYVSRKRWDWD